MIEKYELVDEHDRHGIADKLRGPFCTIDDGRHTWFGGNFFGLKIAAKNEAALRNGMRHLADLIEPQERTCTVEEGDVLSGTDCPAWICSNCGAEFERLARYCSNCGARVIGDGDGE